ncbi:hypothetical protein AB0K60_30700 [Thermopolyspora sp. NPDC052614]|uniref:hypothetical protein n=1 Tax=Thermopolyspora sp. NPDC052614 TaxID=3155682 RepID=UPI0034402B12
MYVQVTGTAERPEVSVEEADDCTRLHVSAGPLDEATVGTMLIRTGLGRPRGPGHVWLDIAALRSRIRSHAPDWPQRFAAMIAHAGRNGWLDASGKLVAAHIAGNER